MRFNWDNGCRSGLVRWPAMAVIAGFLLAGAAASAQETSPADGATTEVAAADLQDPIAAEFMNMCAGCHTVGGGELSGPDLLPATQWAEDELAASVERMEENVGPMSDETVQDFVSLLKDPEVQSRLEAAEQAQLAEQAATLEPASPATGEALFFGSRSLENGAPSCMSCHAVNGRGGTLAVDLTKVFERMGSETALKSAIEKGNFPVMRPIYGAKPVTPQESAHLSAYLKQVSQQPAAQQSAKSPVGLAGVAGAAVLMGLLAMFYRRGNSGGTRKKLVREANRR